MSYIGATMTAVGNYDVNRVNGILKRQHRVDREQIHTEFGKDNNI